jgi:hypothetical protein
MHFWKAFSLLMEGRTAKAMDELRSTMATPDSALASILALIHAHKQAELVDREAIANLEVLIYFMRYFT